MMKCDVCNTAVPPNKGERITTEAFRYLLNNGFGIHESNIAMLIDAGMSREQAVTALHQQYMSSTSDWFLCPQCAAAAKSVISAKTERWINEQHVAVTHIAEEVGLGFDVIGAPVALTQDVWLKCVEWTEEDNNGQCYQEQDARLWDVLFTGGGTLQLKINEFLKNRRHHFSIQCILRDGQSTVAKTIGLVIAPVEMHRNHWLVIDFAENKK